VLVEQSGWRAFFYDLTVAQSDKHISTVDADGVTLAAVQALYKVSLQKDEKIEELSQEVMELRARLARLEYAPMKK
jgi:uncharacterized protein YceH (UPF0502 family)